jgi:general secretion pathway protein D
MLSSPTVFSARRTLRITLSMPAALARVRAPRPAAAIECRRRSGSGLGIAAGLLAMCCGVSALVLPPFVPDALGQPASPAAGSPTATGPAGQPSGAPVPGVAVPVAQIPAAPPSAAAAPSTPASSVVAAADNVTLNFVNADIDAVVKAVADITGRNFLVDPRVKGTVNIVSARPVPRSLVFPTLLSALRMQGFAAVESGGVVKIVPEAEAKQQGGPVVRGAAGPGGDRLVTQVITLRHENAAQLVTVLRPLISPNNTVAAYPASNALVITDYADNLARLSRIIASLDQPSGEPLVVPVRNASALDLANLVGRFLGEGAPGAPGAPGVAADPQQRITLLADPRSNSILVRSDNAARASRARQLIEQLDTPQRAGSNVFIVYLRNADASRVAETLRGLYGGTSAERGPAAAAPMPTTATVTASAPTNVATTTTMTALGSSPAATAPLASGTSQGVPPAFNAAGATIQADVANNALIILAPEAVYNNLRAVIDKLDLRRAQVFIEALIVEVTSDKAAEFGIQWQVLTGADRNRNGVQGIGGTNFGTRGGGNNIIDASVSLGSLGQGLNIGLINGSITIPGLGTISNLGLLVRALDTDNRANILSTPTLLTLDNEEARIIVGQNVPFITGQYATTGTTTTPTPFQTIERRDVGIVLRVRPQITEGGVVHLSLYQEVSRVQESSSAGPILSKRALESSVAVDDQQIVVLGGLIQDSVTDGADKIPYAGDVPIFGSLFRYDSRTRQKTNLLIFLKPTVVRTSADGREITTERYDYLRGEQERLRPGERWFWNDPTYPKVPATPAMPGSAAGTTSTLPPAPPAPR